MQTQEDDSYDEVHDDDNDEDDDDDNNVKGSLYVICPYADTRGPMPRRGYWTFLTVASFDFLVCYHHSHPRNTYYLSSKDVGKYI